MESNKSRPETEGSDLQRTETPRLIITHHEDQNDERTTETQTAAPRPRPTLRTSTSPPNVPTHPVSDDSPTLPGPSITARDFAERSPIQRSPTTQLRDDELQAIPENSRLSLHPSNDMSLRSSQHGGSLRRRRLRSTSQSQARRGTVATIGPPGGVSLAGPSDLPAPATHQPYVEPGYADLNPAYDQPVNARPVWGLAKPLPRVVRPSMVPQADEPLPRGSIAAETNTINESDLERGHVEPSMNVGKISDKLRGARERRESTFLQRWGTRNSVGDPLAPLATTSTPAERRGRVSFSRPGGEIDWDSGRRRPSHIPRPQLPRGISSASPIGGQRIPETEEGRFPDNVSTTTTERDVFDDDDEEKDWVEDDSDLGACVPAGEIHNNHTHWSVIRTHFREPFAEFLAVVVQLTLGFCADLTTVTSNSTNGNAATNYFAWGFATMLGIYVAGGISGAHLNPAVSLMLCMFRGFPSRKVPGYVLAQILGAFVAALISFGIYQDLIVQWGGENLGAGGTAGAFLTYPHSVDTDTAFFTEFVATAILAVAILALGDDTNAPPGAGMSAFVMGLVITVECMAFSNNTGCAMNPSRDFGPRLALLALGYGPKLFENSWWFYGPWGATVTGAFTGAILYDALIFVGGESPVNYPRTRFKRAEKRWREGLTRKLKIDRSGSSVKSGRNETATASS